VVPMLHTRDLTWGNGQIINFVVLWATNQWEGKDISGVVSRIRY